MRALTGCSTEAPRSRAKMSNSTIDESSGVDVARPLGEIAGHGAQLRVGQQEHRAGAAPAVGAQVQRGRDALHAAEPQVVGQVLDLGAHHRGDLAFQHVARQ